MGQFRKLETDPTKTKENYSECFEVLRTYLLKENTNNYFQLVENPVPSMEMLRCITKKR